MGGYKLQIFAGKTQTGSGSCGGAVDEAGHGKDDAEQPRGRRERERRRRRRAGEGGRGEGGGWPHVDRQSFRKSESLGETNGTSRKSVAGFEKSSAISV